MTKEEVIPKIIDQLVAIKERPGMWMKSVTPLLAETLLCGFANGLGIFGLKRPQIADKLATEARGWQYDNLSTSRHMLAAGFSDTETVDELIAIAIDSWRYCLEHLNDDAIRVDLNPNSLSEYMRTWNRGEELAAFATKSDDEIDFSDIPPTTADDWQGATRGRFYLPAAKQPGETIEIKADVESTSDDRP